MANGFRIESNISIILLILLIVLVSIYFFLDLKKTKMTVENLEKDYATCNYGIKFLAAFKKKNIYGTQFHPEKSQTNGIKILKNFLEN